MSVKGKKFIALEARLNTQVSKLVNGLQAKVDALNEDLKEFAKRYPSNPAVLEKLGRFFQNPEQPQINNLQTSGVLMELGSSRKPKTISFGRGRPRFIPRWFAEWNDGTKVEFTPNPMRTSLANHAKAHPDEVVQWFFTDNSHFIVINVNGTICRIRNPYPLNNSGLKTVSIV